MIERIWLMIKLKCILSLVLYTLISTSCVTSGSGSQGGAIAAVVVFSHLVKSAQNGDTSAKKAWCGAFDLVQTEAGTSTAIDPAQESDLKEKLTPQMHDIMRANGYQLHRQQIGMVIQDALNVSRSEDAKQETIKSCATLNRPATES
jgi:hypothetical protein